MPNKRGDGKKNITAWVPEELKEELTKIALKEKLPLSTLIEKILNEEIKEHEKNSDNSPSSN